MLMLELAKKTTIKNNILTLQPILSRAVKKNVQLGFNKS